MTFELPPIPPEERTPLVESLLGIIQQLLDRVQRLEQSNQELRDEIARMQGQTLRPKIAPSRLESGPPPPPSVRPGKKRPTKSELAVTVVRLQMPDPPLGAVLKGFEPYEVQELKIAANITRYLRERYRLPDGTSVLAPLPAEVLPGSHYGPNLIAYVLNQYHHAHVTEALLLQQLHDFGISISAGQLSRILTENKDLFHAEKEEVRQAGLASAAYIGTDDTGARHQGRNGFCTVIGNDLFAYFESSDCKSRVNFLQVLQGEQRRYVINETALVYWERLELPAAVLEKLSQGPREFANDSGWQAYLQGLDITASLSVRIATEGALLGGLIEQGVSSQLALLSDGAPQFDVLVHASCWIHAERPLARMIPHNEEHRLVMDKIRQQIWELYKDLKAYRAQPAMEQRPLLEARFDALCDQRTGYPNIDAVLKEMREHRADLLRVLERPEVPLHNNGAESDIREYVKKRKISGSTRSAAGRRCRDTFASLKKTSRKLGVNFWHYLQDRIRGLGTIPSLGALIRQRAAQASSPRVVSVAV